MSLPEPHLVRPSAAGAAQSLLPHLGLTHVRLGAGPHLVRYSTTIMGIVYSSVPWGPSSKHLHNFTCYLDPLPTPLFACNTNTPCKYTGDLTTLPLPLGAYITNGRSLVIQSATGIVLKEEGQF